MTMTKRDLITSNQIKKVRKIIKKSEKLAKFNSSTSKPILGPDKRSQKSLGANSMNLENYSTEQLEKILDDAPDGAEYYLFDSVDTRGKYYVKINIGLVNFWDNGWRELRFTSIEQLVSNFEDQGFGKSVDLNVIKLSDIRAVLDSRQRMQSEIYVCAMANKGKAQCKELCPDCGSKTTLKSVCVSGLAKNDRQISDGEKSVIERFTNLVAAFREIGEQFQTTNSIEREIWLAAAGYVERELKDADHE